MNRSPIHLPFLLLLAVWIRLVSTASAHDEPTSYINGQIEPNGLAVTIIASATDLAHDLPSVEPGMLLNPDIVTSQRGALEKLLETRLSLEGDGTPLTLKVRTITPDVEKRDLQFECLYPWETKPLKLLVKCHLFPYDSRHKTFLNIRHGDDLERVETFYGEGQAIQFTLGTHQPAFQIFREFLYQGIHHIFIGPDHILFVVGLLLLGGGVRQLLKIITAFTVAHSITLGLATFRVFTPPASIIEPAIAASIVFVGVHALMGKRRHDPRILFAFCFGLIHGFGFAFALQEMTLPQEALGTSLFAFNLGVEAGQCAIVLVSAPLLGLLRDRNPVISRRVVVSGALFVITAGSFWFFQRVLE